MNLTLNNLVGTPWKELPCWELVVEVYKRAGIQLEPYATYWPDMNSPWREVKEPEVGDIIVMNLYSNTADHIAVYVGEGKNTFYRICGRVYRTNGQIKKTYIRSVQAQGGSK